MNKTHTLAHMEGQQLWTDLQKANTEIRRLSAENSLMREAMQEFVDRCEKGSVHSRYTYKKFKDILERVCQERGR